MEERISVMQRILEIMMVLQVGIKILEIIMVTGRDKNAGDHEYFM